MNDRELLHFHAIHPKKSLGQNFLHDPHALEKIVEIADLPPGAEVLEIGAGTGNLTRVLAQHAGRLVAVETDERMLPILRAQFGGVPSVELVHADILALDLAALFDERPYYVVANLPYYITSAILRHLLEGHPRPQRLVITVQREVADRLIAQPDDMSLLTVSVQFYGEPRLMMRLNPAAFWPRPDVESAVVRIDVYPRPPVEVPDEATFFRAVRAGFSQKRKQLRNALAGGLRIDKTAADALLAQAGIEPHRRAETLTLEEWAALARALAAAGL